MREQIRRILGLVRDGRLSAEDAAPLLAALHPRLGQIKAQTLERLFGLLDAEDFGPNSVADLLMAMVEPSAQAQSQAQWGGGQQNQSQSQAAPPRSSATFKVGGASYPLDDLGDAISSRVEEALGGLLGKGSRPARPGTILKIETEDENGGSFSANLPLSLASHAERLIPPHALKSLERSGLSIDALKMLLQAGPPPGPLLEAEDENGNSVSLSIR
ncbi:SHOCT-like domain-containing protein [Deinococcus sp.]|uniref:SHOCT-like domain-containing protein n=1 Tax=Deinococcus sp. TaxID=47478 RepID=UPI003C7ADE2D